MALYIVEEECISCGDCEPVCPTVSIKEGAIVFAINAKTCTECKDDFDSPECVRVCPIDNCILPLEA
ncbi:4Fe-4S binding protein [Methylophaga sp.]|uniref:4Fe-4S binding protein n=1 Tax=Methylophaga sp. TaxID=2024840 RepID=UPI00271CD6B4|nr:4Fe-4S binding protein [Methylophaga sp.]MDO8828109.1 4Fe-4S binding protein [Methylophaga sp.]